MSPPNSGALPYRVLSRKVFANSRQIHNFLLQGFDKSYFEHVLTYNLAPVGTLSCGQHWFWARIKIHCCSPRWGWANRCLWWKPSTYFRPSCGLARPDIEAGNSVQDLQVHNREQRTFYECWRSPINSNKWFTRLKMHLLFRGFSLWRVGINFVYRTLKN